MGALGSTSACCGAEQPQPQVAPPFRFATKPHAMTREMIFALVLGYLFGSIPFGLVLTRIAGKGDVRKIGSGNIGATNVLRTGSKALAALTLVLDCLKATAAIRDRAIARSARGRAPSLPPARSSAISIPSGSGFAAARVSRPCLASSSRCCRPAALVYAAVWIFLLADAQDFVARGNDRRHQLRPSSPARFTRPMPRCCWVSLCSSFGSTARISFA